MQGTLAVSQELPAAMVRAARVGAAVAPKAAALACARVLPFFCVLSWLS